MSSHAREGPASVNDDSQEDGKAWDLKDEFKYAPKRPEGDPWKLLLDPLLEREKKRCDSWNTEIQNLLIFAGLFSGLVTAFIIESYKTLQPDANDDIVAFLAHIAARLDNPTNHTSAIRPPSSTFIAPHAAVRVNIFWFISLILSLTVILSGIIAMQWLREHQAYTGQSSKDMIAILNMRVESLEKWHVKDIITTFPLVLAVALVLFFAGIIDFLHILGNKTVLVAVATVITITLILLVTSTTLPSAQCTLLYMWLGHQEPPSPCPYKSPQSGFFHGICYYISTFLSRRRSRYVNALGDWLRSLTQLNARNKHALLYLTDTWSKKTWAEVDLCWLSIREACLFPRELEEYQEFLDRNAIAPLFDISKTFQGAIDGVKLPSDVLSAMYHCFYEVSTPFVSRDHPKRKGTIERHELNQTFEMIQWRNDFLHSLIHSHDSAENALMVKFLPVDNAHKDARKKFHSNIYILHHHNLFTFIGRLVGQYPRELSDHRVEIGIRLGSALYNRWHEINHTRELPLPLYLRGEIFDQRRWKTHKNDITVPVFQQYAHALAAFFESAAHPDHPIDHSSNRLLVHANTQEFLEKAAWDTYRVMAAHNLSKHPPADRRKALKIFKCLLDKMSSLLVSATSRPSASGSRTPTNPIHLLYFCAIYIRRLNSLRFHAGPSMDQQAIGMLEEAILTMRTHKPAILSSTWNKPDEEWLGGEERFGAVPRFSAEWWRFLDGKHDEHSRDSEASSAHHHQSQKRRPGAATVAFSPAPGFPRPRISSMSGLRMPSSASMLHAASSVAATSSWNSVYSDESYASTGLESPITSGYGSFVSSPTLDHKRPSFETSPVIPTSIPSLKKDEQNAGLHAVPSSTPAQSHTELRVQQGNVITETTRRNDIEMETLDYASNTIVGARRLSMPHPISFPEPVHHPIASSFDNPYENLSQS